MVNQNSPQVNEQQVKLAASAIQRMIAGAPVSLKVTQDYGPFIQVVQAVHEAYEAGGPAAARRAFSILKKAEPRLVRADGHEDFFPVSLELDETQLAEIDKYPYTDLGQSEAMAYLYQRLVRYCVGLGWLIWTGLRWQPDRRGAIIQMAGITARARQQAVLARPTNDYERSQKQRKYDIGQAIQMESQGKLTAVVKLSQSQQSLITDAAEMDADPMLMGVANGVIDLRTGELIEPNPDDLITKRSSVPYIPDAPAPRWEKFLREVFQNNEGLIDYVQRCIGYSITGLTGEHCFWMEYGSGRNGKGTIHWVISQIAGDYATSASWSTFEAGKQSTTGEEIAALRGARIVMTAEPEEGSRMNEARIKEVTGEDIIRARFLYQASFTFQPTFKLWVATNHRPVISGDDIGIWSRVKLIPYNVSFVGKEDRTLKEKLTNELPGILAWAVRGCLAYQEIGLAADATVTAATEAYKTDMDILGQWIAENCTLDTNTFINCTQLHKNYAGWAEDNGLKPLSQPRFSRKMVDRGFLKEKKTAGWVWLGINLNQLQR